MGDYEINTKNNWNLLAKRIGSKLHKYSLVIFMYLIFAQLD